MFPPSAQTGAAHSVDAASSPRVRCAACQMRRISHTRRGRRVHFRGTLDMRLRPSLRTFCCYRMSDRVLLSIVVKRIASLVAASVSERTAPRMRDYRPQSIRLRSWLRGNRAKGPASGRQTRGERGFAKTVSNVHRPRLVSESSTALVARSRPPDYESGRRERKTSEFHKHSVSSKHLSSLTVPTDNKVEVVSIPGNRLQAPNESP